MVFNTHPRGRDSVLGTLMLTLERTQGRASGKRTSFVKQLVPKRARAPQTLIEAAEKEAEALRIFGVSPLMWRYGHPKLETRN